MRKIDCIRDKITKFYGWKTIRLKGSEINRDVYDCVKYVEEIVIKRREKLVSKFDRYKRKGESYYVYLHKQY